MESNNKRIAKNTLLLYFRMLLTMGVSLYTVRIVLETLGVIDYGIYNVVGGVVMMFSFLSGSMASASQRFFSFELGKNNYDMLKKTFSMSVTIYLFIAVVVVLLAETGGLWFLNTQLSIPQDRLDAANWIYQFSVFSFFLTMLAIPYNAAIIAHERMNVYAWVSIIEVTLKLGIVFLLVLFDFDKLKLYAVLVFAVTAIVAGIYVFYCRRTFEEARFSFYWDKILFKVIITYSGWNLFGTLASVFSNQGVSIILNVFFGPVVNAAQSIASQVHVAINQLAANFSTAVNPQIVKYYASGDKNLMYKLVFQSSKFSYFLMFVLSLPLLLETSFILSLWLGDVPAYVVLFTKLVIVIALIDSLSSPLITSLLATGKIKNYQLLVGGIRLFNLPVSYFFFRYGYSPEVTFYATICFAVVSLFLRLIMMNNMLDFPVNSYLMHVILKVFIVTIIAAILPMLLTLNMEMSFKRLIIVLIASFVSVIIVIYFIGLNNQEKCYIKKVKDEHIISEFFNIKKYDDN